MERKLTHSEYYPISDLILESLQRYLNNRIPCGNFLTAVLRDSLHDSFARADIENRRNLFNIVGYIYNYLPDNCWGSKEAVDNWLNN